MGLRVTDDDGAPATATTTRQVTVSGGPPPPPPPGNLIANHSFETNTAGWGSWQASLARVALGGAPDGGFVAQVTRTSGTSFTIDDSAFTVPSTVAGRAYTATAWVKAGSSQSVGKPPCSSSCASAPPAGRRSPTSARPP